MSNRQRRLKRQQAVSVNAVQESIERRVDVDKNIKPYLKQTEDAIKSDNTKFEGLMLALKDAVERRNYEKPRLGYDYIKEMGYESEPFGESSVEHDINNFLNEGNYKLNCATLPLVDARQYAEKTFESYGMSLDEVLPNFDNNYKMLQAKCKKALDVPRIQMPVIEPTDMDEFDRKLKSGKLDIFPPYAKGRLLTPAQMSKQEGDEWVELGVKDGHPTDDVVKSKWTSIPAKDLFPTQSQIWLEKVINNIAKFGKPSQSSSVVKTTIIVSKEGYILDGHHRFGQVMVTDPNLRMKALFIPLEIKMLLEIGRTYGLAIGNQPKA